MFRYAAPLVLSLSFASGAIAQAPAPQSAPASASTSVSASPRPATGNYTGTFQERDGTRSIEAKMNIRHITRDGRVTGTMHTTDHPRKSCQKSLPLNGAILPPSKGGGMRLTVDDGAPAACRRIYYVASAASGIASGTFIDGRSDNRKLSAKKGS